MNFSFNPKSSYMSMSIAAAVAASMLQKQEHKTEVEQFNLPMEVEETPVPFEHSEPEAALILQKRYESGRTLKWFLRENGEVFREKYGRWVKI